MAARPGPYTVGSTKNWFEAPRILDGNGWEVARVACDGQRNDSVITADTARLLAAAPTLLFRVHERLSKCPCGPNNCSECDADRAALSIANPR